jgi:prepilin-type N-terminal cleavage/methylation domain-containing protein
LQKDKKYKKFEKGFTLVETLIALAILAIISAGIFGIFQAVSKSSNIYETRTVATGLANEQMELIRNLPYLQVGTTEGWPQGNIPSTSPARNINNVNYTVHTDVQYVDDQFDELAPNDPYNADYKKARVWVTWDTYPSTNPVTLVTTIVPKGQESIENGGTLSLQVFDNVVAPVSQVSVHIENKSLIPNIDINTQTNSQGELVVPALPVDTGNNYYIRVSKTGYTSDYTVPITQEDPSPTLPNQSIQQGTITEVSFTIDKVSRLTINATGTQGGGSWWDVGYQYRKQITVHNNSANILPAHSTVALNLDHYSLVQANKSLSNGNDIRIVYFDGSTWHDLDRINSTDWNQNGTETKIWFATQQDIQASALSDTYFLYYDNSSASNPNTNLTSIFTPERDSDTAGLYYFENSDGTIITDSSGNNNNGTVTNPNWTAGFSGHSLLYDLPSAYAEVSVADNSSLDIEGQLTLEAWVNPTSIAGNQTIIDRLNDYALWLDNGIPSFGVFDQVAGLKSIQATDPVPTDTWSYVSGTYLPGNMKIFVNGEEKNSKSETVTYLAVNSSPLTIGNGNNFGEKSSQFIGKIDSARISDIIRVNFPFSSIPDTNLTLGEEESVIGANPVAGISLNIVGERPIGHDGEGNPIIRNNFLNQTTNASGQLILTDIEWDKYTITLASDGYDLAEISPPNPVNITPNENQVVTLVLVPHTDNSLKVTVVDSSKDPINQATVHVTNNGFDQTKATGSAGQVFFSALNPGTYNIEVTKDGFETITTTQDVSGQSSREIILAP